MGDYKIEKVRAYIDIDIRVPTHLLDHPDYDSMLRTEARRIMASKLTGGELTPIDFKYAKAEKTETLFGHVSVDHIFAKERPEEAKEYTRQRIAHEIARVLPDYMIFRDEVDVNRCLDSYMGELKVVVPDA